MPIGIAAKALINHDHPNVACKIPQTADPAISPHPIEKLVWSIMQSPVVGLLVCKAKIGLLKLWAARLVAM